MSIAILTPSRGRPQALAEMIRSICETVSSEVVRVYVGLDDDDHEAYNEVWDVYGSRSLVLACHADPLPGESPEGARLSVSFHTRPRMQLGPWTNVLSEIAIGEGFDVLASFGDDHRPRTRGWDTMVMEAMRRIAGGLVYTRDGLQDARLPTAPFWSARVIEALGWYFPPGQLHLYADDFWLRLAGDLGRCVYLPGVLVEHLHPSAGHRVADAVNEESDALYDHDQQAFERFVRSVGYRQAVEHVRDVLVAS